MMQKAEAKDMTLAESSLRHTFPEKGRAISTKNVANNSVTATIVVI
jgi:hypothetical protein